jgi:hypothetical protein
MLSTASLVILHLLGTSGPFNIQRAIPEKETLELEHEAGHEDEGRKIADNEHTIQEMRLLVRLRYKFQLFYMLTMIIRRATITHCPIP